MKFIGLIASVLAYLFASSGLAHSLEPGRYSGTYTCYQGPTDVTVEVFSDSKSGTGRFVFSGAASGSYIIRIVGDGDLYDLVPVRWERQPSGYHMVGARLRRSGDQLDGWITGDQYCKEMHITRVDSARISEPAETKPAPRILSTPSQSGQTSPQRSQSDAQPAAPREGNSGKVKAKLLSRIDLLSRPKRITCVAIVLETTKEKAAEIVDLEDKSDVSMKKAEKYLTQEEIEKSNSIMRDLIDSCLEVLRTNGE